MIRLAIALCFCTVAVADDKPVKVVITYELASGKKVVIEETSDKPDADLGPKKEPAKEPAPAKKAAPTRGTIKPNPTDEKAVAEHDRVRPRLETKRPEAVMKMAEELGKPVVAWVENCWPDDSDDAAEFFAELSEATHVALADAAVGKGKGPRVAFRLKDGSWAWLPDGCLNLENAKKVRAKWQGQMDKQSDTPATADTTHLTMMAGRQLPEGYTYNVKNNMVCGPDGCMPATEFVARQAGGYAAGTGYGGKSVAQAAQAPRYAAPMQQQRQMMAPQQMSQAPQRRYGSGG